MFSIINSINATQPKKSSSFYTQTGGTVTTSCSYTFLTFTSTTTTGTFTIN